MSWLVKRDPQLPSRSDADFIDTTFREMTRAKQQRRDTARLVVGLDLTASRDVGLEQARIATAAMFEALRAIGRIAVQLIYYRGTRECRATEWHDNPADLIETMKRLRCKAGGTQICRLLRMALDAGEVSGVVFVGDHCEEDRNELRELARQCGQRKIPIFVFHELDHRDDRGRKAKPIFEQLAALSGGVYSEFNSYSGDVLRELLSTVGAYSVSGAEGVKQVAPPKTPEAKQLQSRLLLLPPPDGKR